MEISTYLTFLFIVLNLFSSIMFHNLHWLKCGNAELEEAHLYETSQASTKLLDNQ